MRRTLEAAGAVVAVVAGATLFYAIGLGYRAVGAFERFANAPRKAPPRDDTRWQDVP